MNCYGRPFREDALVQDDGSTQQEGTDALIDAISTDKLDKAFLRMLLKQEMLMLLQNGSRRPGNYEVSALSTGAVVVGQTGSGKSTLVECVLAALESIDGVKGECHWIDPKALV